MQEGADVQSTPRKQQQPYILCCVMNTMNKCMTVPKSDRMERFVENNPSLFLPQREDGLLLVPFAEWYIKKRIE